MILLCFKIYYVLRSYRIRRSGAAMSLKEKFRGFIPSLRHTVLECTMSFIPGELLYPCGFRTWTCSVGLSCVIRGSAL